MSNKKEEQKLDPKYVAGYTDALSHVQGSLADLSGQMQAVTQVMMNSLEKDSTTETSDNTLKEVIEEVIEEAIESIH